MNNYSRNFEFAVTGQTASGGKLSDVQRILKLAVNSISKEKYSLAIDYCRKAVNGVNGGKDPAAEAYYIWCLSSLKINKPQEARKVCYEARLKLGNYLDLVYFETLVAAANGELDKIPRFAENFMELYEAAGGNFNPYREKTNIHIGKVLLMAGEALEQSRDTARADYFYNKYLAIFPDDEQVGERVNKIAR